MFTSDDDLARIARGISDASLPRAEWTHAAHFAVAVWILERRPDLDPFRDMSGFIRGYNAATGGANTDTEGYHETITQASLRAARAFIDGLAAPTPLHAAVNALLASPLGHPDWLLDYWSKDVLLSVAARRGWVEPDLNPLPF